jgi:hypothetical protein
MKLSDDRLAAAMILRIEQVDQIAVIKLMCHLQHAA